MATRNRHKYSEAKTILSDFGFNLALLEINRVEIQADDPAEIAIFSLKSIPDDGKPILVEDAGLFIDNYRDFPGPYSSYTLRTIQLSGVLKLMEGVENRGAHFKSVVALRRKGYIKSFCGVARGSIAHVIRGTGGFGFDPIFIPSEGDGRAFGEMTPQEKNALSHRAKAFRSLGGWLANCE